MKSYAIDIQPGNGKSFTEKFGNMNLETYTNTLIEKDLNGLKPEIYPVQLSKLQEVAQALDLTVDEVLNQILIRIDLDIRPVKNHTFNKLKSIGKVTLIALTDNTSKESKI